VGSLAGIATTFLEKDVGFWVAYLLPLCVLAVGAATLILCKDKFGKLATIQSTLVFDLSNSVQSKNHRGGISCLTFSAFSRLQASQNSTWPQPGRVISSTAFPGPSNL
jgi:hypothetical protein